jgi:hypothetical protein
MVDHQYLSELNRALHLYLDLSFLICFTLTAIRAAGVTQAIPAASRPEVRREAARRR